MSGADAPLNGVAEIPGALAAAALNMSHSKVLPHIVEKGLFPLDSNDIVIAVLTFFASALGAAGGIGGGGIMVPMLVSVGGFSIHHAIPLTQATVFGASIMNLVQNARKRHPDLDRPLIDYDTALILEVTTLIGTVVGVDMNRVSPVWLITILLILTLGYTTYRTLKKAFELKEKEKDALNSLLQDGAEKGEAGESGEQDRLVDHKESLESIDAAVNELDLDDDDGPSPAAGDTGSRRQNVELDELNGSTRSARISKLSQIQSEERVVPQRQVVRMGLCTLIILVISLVKGGDSGSDMVECGTLEYWLVKLTTFPILGSFTIVIARELMQKHKQKESLGHNYAPSEVQWTKSNALHYPCFCVTAGIAAGLLGIGGVASATAAYMLFFTTFSTTVQFGIMGEMLWDYGAMLFAVGLVSSIFGQVVLGWLVNKYKKQYLISMLIGIVIGVSTLCMGISGMARTFKKYYMGEWLGFNSLCAVETPPGGVTVSQLAGDDYEPAFN